MKVKLAKFFVAVLSLVWLAQSVRGAATEPSLILAADAARPGDTVMAGLRLHMQPNWHVYWHNPGIGIPPTIKWQLPAGITAGEIQWPVPGRLTVEDLTTYVYEDDVVLLVPLTISAEAKTGPAQLKARVDWQECYQSCINQHGDIQAELTIGNERTPSPEASIIEAWQKKLPLHKPDLGAQVSWAGAATGDTRPLLFEWPASGMVKDADFYPDASDKYEVQGDVQFTQPKAGWVSVRKIVKKFEGASWPEKISGLLVQTSDSGKIGYETSLPISEKSSAQSSVPASASQPVNSVGLPITTGGQSGILMLLYAFLGGLILNVMPCVLPVIALKILGFVNQTKEHPERMRKLGLVYALGVLVSFLALAILVILVKGLGHAASWGMQFQNPQFLIVMTVLVSLVALNLFGVFEINLSGSVMGAAGNLASKEGYAGAFLNGVLATILATPCTAPFLAPALGFAFTQPAVIIIMVFLMVGLGLAAPYVILSWQPAWLKFLPRPGAWMEKFKIAMGFPMLATAIWLFTLVTAKFGEDGDLWFGLFLVLIGLSAWVWGEFVQRGRKRQGLAMAVCVAILLFNCGYLLEDQMDWRHPMPLMKGSLKVSPDGIDWQPWSVATLQQARSSGRPILVDFTAKNCLQCKVNKKTSLEIQRVRARVKEINAIALEGFLDDNDPATYNDIVAELTKHERAGVPLVLVYSKNPSVPPQVLPAVLTPGIVLDALDKAAVN